RVMDFHHHTPGNLRAMVQTKLRNLLNGSQTEVRFSSTEDIPTADVYSSRATYLYSDSIGHHFMKLDTYDQVAISAELIADGVYYLQEGLEVDIMLYNEAPIGIELPKTVVLTVAETEPELRGATASNSPKPAKTETGLVVSVPPFIKIGDRITIDTADGKYLSRGD
ncbi:MAG TPA: elongation factor P, partial [Oligoflexia bacterium]|nr:elongation factor P [Oligoflexia bacterium]